ncbi:HNH endonuclease [Leucobacter iarius]|uniref:HNH endonuclease signature motif containing protein n=1 Tax=Leucobacter iarius TaxID=333963 RepID=A0ABN2LJI1_9MICO
MASKRGGRAQSGLTRLVLETYGTRCHLRMPGCLGVATTKDHLIPWSHGGTDTLENLRPACKRCNSKRQNRVLSGYGAIIKVVTGPPAAGKTTYIAEHAKPEDIVIDLDAITRSLMPAPPATTHVYPEHVRHVAIGARKAAIDRATRIAYRCTVWIIHSIPPPNVLAEYRALRYQIITIDPGREVVEQRARTMRPRYVWPTVAKWYATYPTGCSSIVPPLERREQPTAEQPRTAEPVAAGADW